MRSRAGSRRAGRAVVLTGRRAEPLAALAEELGGRAIAADLVEPDAPARLLAEAGDVDVLVANAALPGERRARQLHPRADRPRARGQPARADPARAAADRAAGGAPRRAPRVRRLAVGQVGRAALVAVLGDEVRARAASRSRCGRTSPSTASGCRWCARASSATRACSPTPAPGSRPASGRARPRTSPPPSCGRSRRDRAEIDVAPLAAARRRALRRPRAGSERGRPGTARLVRGGARHRRRPAGQALALVRHRRPPARPRRPARDARARRRGDVRRGRHDLAPVVPQRAARPAARLGHGRIDDQQPRRDARRARGGAGDGRDPAGDRAPARARAPALVAVHRRAVRRRARPDLHRGGSAGRRRAAHGRGGLRLDDRERGDRRRRASRPRAGCRSPARGSPACCSRSPPR